MLDGIIYIYCLIQLYFSSSTTSNNNMNMNMNVIYYLKVYAELCYVSAKLLPYVERLH